MCEVRIREKEARARVQLESAEIVVGDPVRLKIPFTDIKTCDARGGTLSVTFGQETLRLALGPDADKWALKIRHPRGRLDKLGIKPGMRVAVIGIEDEGFRKELADRKDDVTHGKARKDTDVVVVGMSSRRDLPRLGRLRSFIRKNGAIWVLWPKGGKEFREDDVRAQGTKTGLVDVKVVSFSDTLSGLKLVIPVKER